MENAKQEGIEKSEEKKSGLGSKIFNFLAMGGIIVVIIVAFAIFLLVSILIGK